MLNTLQQEQELGIQVDFSKTKLVKEVKIDIFYFIHQGLEITCYFNHKENGYCYKFYFEKKYLQRFGFDDAHPFALKINHNKNYNQKSAICCNVVNILQSLVVHEYNGAYASIFIESQALQILLHTHSDCSEHETPSCYNCKFLNSPIEQQKIMQARVLTMINISNPMSIPQLAKAVHINECYLKKGFKEMFGQSIYDFVQHERMKKAKQLMQINNMSITDIAIELGFSNTSNFTNSFKKHTGCSPSEWNKNN